MSITSKLSSEELTALFEALAELEEECNRLDEYDRGVNSGQKEPITVMFAEALEDMEKVSDLGGVKHGYGSWKNYDNPSLQHKANCASMFRHAAEVSCGIEEDPESGMDPLLHLAWRAMAAYTRKVRGYNEDV